MASALDRLLEGLVDYAGLFPPAALAMPDAVRRYAAYRAATHRALLARFVVPVARLDEFVAAARGAGQSPAAGPWPLAVLAAVPDAPTLDAFRAAHGARWRIDTVEAKASDTATIAALADAIGSRYTTYVEIPVHDDPSALVAELAARGLRAKLRTGGVSADAFPTPTEVARFLDACQRLGVAFKATAGLHHPLRGEYALTYDAASARGTMYGFLNVFLAAVLLYAGHDVGVVAPLLEERDATAIAITPEAIIWRGLRADAAVIAAARERFAGSFGSCSFEEPVQDLAALTLLPPPR
ncbi:MAG: hypothetical protein WD771_05655 [Gemmatimonadaceae bacterium]